MEVSKLILNPIRMRIVQFLMGHESTTAGELLSQLSDVPRTTLYRHLNKLEKYEVISVVSKNKVRGQIEKVYSLNKETMRKANHHSSIPAVQYMMNLSQSFESYFSKPNADPIRDQLFMRTAMLHLNEKEFEEFVNEMGAVFKKYLEFELTDSRKVRVISTISSPYEIEVKDKKEEK